MKKKRIYQNPKKIIFLDPPNPCPLSVSDWMNYLTSIRNSFHNGVIHFDSAKHSGIIFSVTLAALFVAIWIPIEIFLEYPPSMILLTVIIVFFFSILSVKVFTKYHIKMQEHQVECRDTIHDVINCIMSGSLIESDSIRYFYNQKVVDLNEKGNKLIKELKLESNQ